MAEPSYRKQSGPLIFFLMLAGFGLTALIIGPTWERARRQSRYTECTTNLEMIADRQQAIHAEGGGYLSCATYPRELPTEAAAWEEGPPCWIKLGFQRDIELRGQYRVDGGLDGFTATCWVDLDGDGDAAKFDATHELTTRRDEGWED